MMSVETAILSVHLANFVPNHPCHPRNPRFPCPISKNRRSTTDKRRPIACFSARLPTQLIGPSLGATPIAPRPTKRREHSVAARPARAGELTRRARAHLEDGMARAKGRRTCGESKRSSAPAGNTPHARWSKLPSTPADQQHRGFESDAIRRPK